jgi:hypothetical protein
LAAKVEIEGNWNDFQRQTVDGTERMLKIAKEMKV